MRIGTWNMEGRGGGAQTDFLLAQDCDVLLLTEVPVGWTPPGHHLTSDTPLMGPTKRWAAVAAREPLTQIDSPHPTTTAAVIAGTTYVSSVLPWSGSGVRPPWIGASHTERLVNTVEALMPLLRMHRPLVWGGDWNHSLQGPERVGSAAGRRRLLEALDELGLSAPTGDLAHRENGLSSIDHVATPVPASRAVRVEAVAAGRRLSDHEFYAVDVR